MKYGYLIFIITVFAFPLFSQNIELTGDKNSLQITGSFEIKKISSKYISNEKYNQIKISECINTGKYGEAELPAYTKLVSLPETGNFKVINLKYEFEETDIDKKIVPFGWQDNQNFTDNYYKKNQWMPEDIITISKPNIMRGIRFSQITIAAVQYNPALNKIRVLKNIDLDFEIDHLITDNPLTKSTSQKAFTKLAETRIFGTDTIRDSQEGQYLFISPDNVATILEPLLRWKEKLGYKTKLTTLSETGSTNDAIKDYLQNAYDNWETPPEYVVLVGDVSGSIVVPSFYVQGYYTPWDVTDHSYTLLDGDDYFPDIMIGRISVQSQNELNTVINKIISYESDPYMETDWMKRALMISYVDDSWWQLHSARETVMAVREKLLDFEFTEVDTFISPWQTSSPQLINKINSGYSFVNYRGAGAPSYWYEPYFNSDHVNNLSNGYMLPMVTSITCGGGDFAYTGNPSCFGETWLIAGSPSVPKGAIAFIGPSELDTKTWFNNAIDMGIYHGVTQENLFKCAEMMLAGKMDAYINYPYCHAWGGAEDSDQFYFYVYNLLGDPGLAIWTDIPQEVDIVFESEFNSGLNYLEVEIVNPFIDRSGFTIAITNSDSLVVCGLTDETGSVVIPVDLQPGDYCVTASKYGFIPKTEDLTVIEEDIVALFDYSLEETISGQTVNLEATFKNLGNQTAEDIEIELVSNDDYIQILSGSASTSTLAPEEIFISDFQFEIEPEWKNGFQFELYFNVNSNFGFDNFLVLIEIQSPEVCLSDFIVNNPQGKLIQNTTCEVNIELLNCGSINCEEFYVNLTSLNYNTNVISGSSTFPSIPVNNTAINLTPFEIEVSDVMSGELAHYKLEILNLETVLQVLEFTIPIGIINENSPTFSEYGYFAIESTDTGYFTAPEYNWIEIDPDYGGPGTLITAGHTTVDGYTQTIDLPFYFSYFGEVYDKISICSNGWISLGETELVFSRNRNIPSGSGPRAMIAPFWDDLCNGDIYSYNDFNNHYLVIEWSDFQNKYNYSFEIFEVILYDPEFYPTPTGDGDILFQYKEIHNVDQEENYATVGIENKGQTDGLLITFANIYPQTVHTLQNETAILFSTQVEPLVYLDERILQTPLTSLSQNYPNPFNPTTTISFNISRKDAKNAKTCPPWRIEIYNLKGQKVKQLLSSSAGQLSAGKHSVTWNGTDENNQPVGSGIYFYNLKVGNKSLATKKCLLLK